MKILIFNQTMIDPSLGGVERVLDVLISEFKKENIKIEIAYFQNLCNCNKRDDIIQYQLPISEVNNPLNTKYLINLVKERKYDLIVNALAIQTRTSRCIAETSSTTKIPLINVYHNSIETPLRYNCITNKLLNVRLTKPFMRLMLHMMHNIPFYKGGKWLSRKSTAQIVLSKSYINDFIQLIDNNPSNLLYIHNPLPFKINREEKEFTKENIALFVGRLTTQKNLLELLNIWKLASTKDWKLIIVGDGIQKEEIKNYINNNNLGDKVILCGRSNPIEYYCRAKLFLMTSSFEGYPMTLLESQSFGVVPIIYNSYAAAKEIINDGENGYLIDNNDRKNFIIRIEDLINNEEKIINMSKQCIRSSVNHDSKIIADQWIELFNSILKK